MYRVCRRHTETGFAEKNGIRRESDIHCNGSECGKYPALPLLLLLLMIVVAAVVAVAEDTEADEARVLVGVLGEICLYLRKKQYSPRIRHQLRWGQMQETPGAPAVAPVGDGGGVVEKKGAVGNEDEVLVVVSGEFYRIRHLRTEARLVEKTIFPANLTTVVGANAGNAWRSRCCCSCSYCYCRSWGWWTWKTRRTAKKRCRWRWCRAKSPAFAAVARKLDSQRTQSFSQIRHPLLWQRTWGKSCGAAVALTAAAAARGGRSWWWWRWR